MEFAKAGKQEKVKTNWPTIHWLPLRPWTLWLYCRVVFLDLHAIIFSLIILFIVQPQSSTYQANCALFDKSTKIGTHVDFYLIKIFGYGGALKYPHGDHSKRLKMATLKFHYFSLKRYLSTSLSHNSS